MMTSLPKHRGRNGPILAFSMLVATTVVVLLSERPRTHPSSELASRAIPAAPAPPSLPAASIPAVPAAPSSSLRGSGTIGYDESKTSHLAAPVAGWLTKTRTKSLGRTVRAGETLGVIYSPEVYLTSVELLQQVKEFRSADALDASQTHLLRLGMPPWTLTAMQKSGKPERSVPLIARVNGTVVVDSAQRAQLVDTWSDELFTITDPTRYWLYVDLPVVESANVQVGTTARVTIEGAKAPINGTISRVFRRVEGGMRTFRIDIQSRTPLHVGNGATAEIKL